MEDYHCDKYDNPIGGDHVDYDVMDLSKYGVESRVSKSEQSESVYVYYRRGEKVAKVRFSRHYSSCVYDGGVMDGWATKQEILFELGLMDREFIPSTHLIIGKNMVKMSDVENYEEADLTIQEMYALGAGADLSPYVGKLAKGSRYLIFSQKVEEVVDTRKNWLGAQVPIGHYLYTPKEEFSHLFKD